MNPLVDILTMNFPHATETVCIFMAIEGSMAVRNGPNRANTMHWFHAFLRSSLTAYAGGLFTNIFMGRPTAVFANDIFFGACLIGYALVNLLPMDVGYHFFNTMIGRMLFTVFSQVFRMGGVSGFSDVAYNAFKDAPSVYYPTPVFGPILFPTALGNMGGFLWNGFDGYLEKGMPWMFQQGLSTSVFYHFYTHDAEGFIGVNLRSVVRPVAIQIMTLLGADEKESLNDTLFAKFAVSCFIVTLAILRMPQFLGPRFSPFVSVSNMVGGMLGGKKKKVNAKPSKKNKKKNQ